MKQGLINILRRYRNLLRYAFLRRNQKNVLRQLQTKDKITIVFFAMCLPMWRYQNLYKLLSNHPAFRVFIVLSPCVSYSKAQQRKDIEGLRSYFEKNKTPYIDYDFDSLSCVDVRREIEPDILFYPQPYEEILRPEHDHIRFLDRLLCYYPYAFWTASGEWSYNLRFHNIAWKLYYSTELHRKDAQKIALNKGRNVVVVGYPNADDFINVQANDVWKKQPERLKRLIWAPHFTISKERSTVMHSNFLWMADLMLGLAKNYSERLQIAFKPHPRLLTELYVHPEWGKERAESYYQQWEELANGQVDEGEYRDLFLTSDAMIHDCGSFTVEYHYTLNPTMYVLQDEHDYVSTLSDFGKEAIKAHYIGKTEKDIIKFIEEVVLGTNDEMLPVRKEFHDKYLLPPHGKSVAENTMEDMLKSLGRL